MSNVMRAEESYKKWLLDNQAVYWPAGEKRTEHCEEGWKVLKHRLYEYIRCEVRKIHSEDDLPKFSFALNTPYEKRLITFREGNSIKDEYWSDHFCDSDRAHKYWTYLEMDFHCGNFSEVVYGEYLPVVGMADSLTAKIAPTYNYSDYHEFVIVKGDS